MLHTSQWKFMCSVPDVWITQFYSNMRNSLVSPGFQFSSIENKYRAAMIISMMNSSICFFFLINVWSKNCGKIKKHFKPQFPKIQCDTFKLLVFSYQQSPNPQRYSVYYWISQRKANPHYWKAGTWECLVFLLETWKRWLIIYQNICQLMFCQLID